MVIALATPQAEGTDWRAGSGCPTSEQSSEAIGLLKDEQRRGWGFAAKVALDSSGFPEAVE